MELNKETYDLVTQLVMSVVPSAIIAGLLYTLLKTFITYLKDYIMLLFDSTGVGSRVLYNGTEYTIQEINFRKIMLVSKNRMLIVPTTEWSKMAIVIQLNHPNDT